MIQSDKTSSSNSFTSDNPAEDSARRADGGPSAKIRRSSSIQKLVPVAKNRDREQQRKYILDAVKDGRMGFRYIQLKKESQYLAQDKKLPRPLYVIKEGIPVVIVKSFRYTIAILEWAPSFLMKNDGATNAFTGEFGGPLSSSVKGCKPKFLPDLAALHTKLQEQYERFFRPIYQTVTSGHLNPDGTFALPKSGKVKSEIEHSEVVIQCYEKDQICGLVVNSDELCTMLANNGSEKLLLLKQKLQEKLQLAELPLIVYSEKTGDVQVLLDEEVNIVLSLANFGINKTAWIKAVLQKVINQLTYKKNDTSSSLHSLIQTSENRIVARWKNNYGRFRMVTEPEFYCIEKFRVLLNEFDDPITKLLLPDGRIDFLTDILVRAEVSKQRDVNPAHKKESSKKANELFIELLKRKVPFYSELFFYAGSVNFPHLLKSAIAARCLYTDVLSFEEGNGYYYKLIILTDDAVRRFALNMLIDMQSKLQHPINTNLMEMLSPRHLEHLHHMNNNYKDRFKDNDITMNSDIYKESLLLLYRHGANPEQVKEELLEQLKKYQNDEVEAYQMLYGGRNPNDVFDSILEFWRDHQSHPLYKAWPDKLASATAEIDALTEELGLTDYQLPPSINSSTTVSDQNNLIEAIANEFKKPLQFTSKVGDNDETVRMILDHYYRGPGPEEIGNPHAIPEPPPDIWKPTHSCGHVLRVHDVVRWLIELLEKYKLAEFSQDEKELLPLAAICHDAAAKVVPKKDEETFGARYFKRDLTNHYPCDLVDAIAEALSRKEDDVKGVDEDTLDGKIKLYVSVLRTADRLDSPRFAHISPKFPQWNQEKVSGFDSGLLALPVEERKKFSNIPEDKTDFQNDMESAMNGALDIMAISEDLFIDKRENGGYIRQYGLNSDINKYQKRECENTLKPLSLMDGINDDNVRRMIAARAGIKTCSDLKHISCQANPYEGKCYGIHNAWHDLKQVKVPSVMTRLEKVQCGHNFTVLSAGTRDAIDQEVARLQKEGIQLNLGTLTQETLRSAAAQKVLDKRGIKVRSELRRRGFKETGQPNYEEWLFPWKE